VLWTYACLFITHLWSWFYFIYCLLLSIFEDGSWFCACAGFCSNRDRSIVMLTSPVRLYPVLHFEAPEWFLVCWQIASYSYMSSHMAFSRKYGTIWYHPASSKLWNLTTLSFVNFQEKLTGTSWNLFACEASLFGLLCAWRRVLILCQQTRRTQSTLPRTMTSPMATKVSCHSKPCRSHVDI
jgi:hypothetical protein